MENNKQILNKIKLMMSYDLGKTLNENVKSIPLLSETKIEVDEDAFLKGAVDAIKDAKSLGKVNPKLFNALGDVLKVTGEEGKQIKGLTTPGAVQHVAIRDVDGLVNAIKQGMKPNEVAQLYKGLLKSKNTPSNILQSITRDVVESKKFIKTYGNLTDKQLRAELVKRGYSDLAIEAISKETRINKTFKAAKVNKPKAKPNTTPGVEPQITPTNVTNPQEAAKVLVDGAKNAENAEIKAVAEEGEKLVEENPKKWSLLNDIKEKLKKKYWYYLGAIPLVGVVYATYKALGFGRPDTDLFNNNCIDELIDDGSATVTYTTGGDPVIYVKKTGNGEYDKMGGLNFFNNGRVVSRDRKKRGYWKCSGEGLSANTQGSNSSREMQVIAELDLEEQVKIDQQLNNDVNAMIRLLDLPVSQNDLKNANTLLTNYANNGKGKEFLQKYEDSGIGPGGMKDSLDYIYTSNPTSVDYKNNLYKIIKQIESGGEETADLGGIQITWDQPGSVTPKPDETKPDKTKQQTYKDCSSVDINTTPLTYGCKDNRISEVQGCIGVAVDGKFGPNTLKALVDNGYEATSGLTKEMYDKIIANCKKGEASTGAVEGGADVNYLRNPIKLDLGPTPELPKFSSKTESGEDFYKRLVTNGNFRAGQIGNDRVKYKGTDLNSEDLAKLNEYVASNGYRLIKNKDKGAQYGGGENDKYVWQKSE